MSDGLSAVDVEQCVGKLVKVVGDQGEKVGKVASVNIAGGTVRIALPGAGGEKPETIKIGSSKHLYDEVPIQSLRPATEPQTQTA